MVILDKTLKFIKWFNSNDKASQILNEGDFFETDEAVIFVVCKNEKIITMGHFTEKRILEYLDLEYSVIEKETFEWIEGESKNTQYNNNGKAGLKTQEMLNQEDIVKVQQQLLNQFKPLIDAMNTQINAKNLPGINLNNLMFTDQECTDWYNYISEIANGNIEAIMPELPEKYKKIVGSV